MTTNLHLNQLLTDLGGDPSLALIPASIRPQVLQTLFIASGCDYISFFAGFGKTSVLKCFYENAWFVSGTQEFPGTLADTMPSSLAFIRLVGTMYFKKHLSVFSFNTPRALFMSLDENSMSAIDHHKRFIEVIRDLVWSRIKFEDKLTPSFEAFKGCSCSSANSCVTC